MYHACIIFCCVITIYKQYICIHRHRVRNCLITHTQARNLDVTDCTLSQLPCMRFKAAETTYVSRYYLAEQVQHLVRVKRREAATKTTYAQAFQSGPDIADEKPRRSKKARTLTNRQQAYVHVQPMNTAAALSLSAEPVADRVHTITLEPRALAALQDYTNKKRGRGRVATTPEERNTRRVCDRVVGLDGCTVRERVFRSTLERRRYRQQQRRTAAKAQSQNA